MSHFVRQRRDAHLHFMGPYHHPINSRIKRKICEATGTTALVTINTIYFIYYPYIAVTGRIPTDKILQVMLIGAIGIRKVYAVCCITGEAGSIYMINTIGRIAVGIPL